MALNIDPRLLFPCSGFGKATRLPTEAFESVRGGRPPCTGRQARPAANMAALFSACFLVAVTQHAGSSYVIIGGEMETHGN